MGGSFVVLVHLPRVAATPAVAFEWVQLATAAAIAAAALAVGGAARSREVEPPI